VTDVSIPLISVDLLIARGSTIRATAAEIGPNTTNPKERPITPGWAPFDLPNDGICHFIKAETLRAANIEFASGRPCQLLILDLSFDGTESIATPLL